MKLYFVLLVVLLPLVAVAKNATAVHSKIHRAEPATDNNKTDEKSIKMTEG